MEIAKAKKCDVLIVTDFSGNINMLNLALFKVNPLQISIDATFTGFHDTEDPAILCMAYHAPSRVVFSGGDDRSIRYWRLPKDIDYKTAGGQHPGAVCCLVATEHLLVSGDEEGRVNVWVIEGAEGSSGEGGSGDAAAKRRCQLSLPALTLVGSWSLGPYAAIRSVSAVEVFGGVYVSYISRLNKTSVHFLSFSRKTLIEIAVSPEMENIIDSPTVTVEQPPPTARSPLPEGESPNRQRRRSSMAMDNDNLSSPKLVSIQKVPQYSMAVQWVGMPDVEILETGGVIPLRRGAEPGREQRLAEEEEEEEFTGGYADDADPVNKKFCTVPAYGFVQCFDVDEFPSSALGKEPTTVSLQCAEDKRECYTFVGTENGSIYKYTSDMIQL